MTDQELNTTEERISTLCEWFDIKGPELEYEDGEILLTDSLLHWFEDNCVSMDWIFCGDPRVMAAATREKWTWERKLKMSLRQMTDTNRELFMSCVRRFSKVGVSFDDAFAPFKNSLQ